MPKKSHMNVIFTGLVIVSLMLVSHFGNASSITKFVEIKSLSGHSGAVSSARYSPDHKLIASGSFDRSIRIWDGSSGNFIRTFGNGNDVIHSISWSPDSSRIVSGSGDKSVEVWNSQTGSRISRMTGHDGYVRSVAWSPNGSRIASGASDKTVKIWDENSGRNLANLTGHTDWVNSIAWSPDGTKLASGSGDRTIKIWNPVTGGILQTISGHTSTVKAVSWSPDGKTLASGSDDRTVRLWNMDTYTSVRILTGHTGAVNSVAWSPDGGAVASGSDDKTIILWNATSGEKQRILTSHSDIVRTVAWSPDGTRILSGSEDYVIRIWGDRDSRPVNNMNTTALLGAILVVGVVAAAGVVSFVGMRRAVLTSQKAVSEAAKETVVLPEVADQIELRSSHDFNGGYLVIIIGILKKSASSLSRCELDLKYNSKVLRIEKVIPDGYEWRGDKVCIGEILAGDSKTTIEFQLDPLICTGTEVGALLSYHDSAGKPRDIRMNSIKIEVVCPLLTTYKIPSNLLNTASLKPMFERLEHKNGRAFTLPQDLDADKGFAQALEAVEKLNVKRIRESNRLEGGYRNAWYYGSTEAGPGRQQWEFIVNVTISYSDRKVEILAASQSLLALTGFLAKVGQEYSDLLSRKGINRPITKIIEIRDSIIYKSSIE